MKRRNETVSKHGEVKPRVLEKLDKAYWSAKKRGDHEEAQRIKEKWEAVENSMLNQSSGFANSLANNLSLGVIPRGKSDNADYQRGQKVGDAASLALSVASMDAGVSMMGQGKTELALSASSLVVPGGQAVSMPIAASGGAKVVGGVALTSYGAAVAEKVAANQLNFEGDSKGGGKVEYKKTKSNVSGKEGAKKPPDWAKGNRPQKGESGKNFARRLMDEKYGKGNWNETGPGSEFNKIKKWGDRSFE